MFCRDWGRGNATLVGVLMKESQVVESKTNVEVEATQDRQVGNVISIRLKTTQVRRKHLAMYAHITNIIIHRFPWLLVERS